MRLLIAEDEYELARALSVILSHEGYDVVICGDGREALSICEKEVFDGYIFDIMMPVMDGITLLETLRAKGDKTPALFLTAKSTTEDTIRGLDAGADDYLTKPFAMGELLARVRVLLRRGEQGDKPQDKLSWSNILLDRKNQMLESPSMRLALTPDETDLLALLIDHNGKQLSRQAIISRLFADDDGEALSLYLDYLEQKLTFVGADGRLHRREGKVWLEVDGA